MFNSSDRTILRDLARRVRDIAALPIMEERRRLWKAHNSLGRGRPLQLIFPEGSWRELMPAEALRCEDPGARQWEAELRRRIYYHEHFQDDTVIEALWPVPKAVTNSGWGVEARWHPAPNATGSRAFDPVLHTSEDLKKIRMPRIGHDEAESAARLERARDLLGDLLDVRLQGIAHVSFHPMALVTAWHGLEQTARDMMLEPGLIHEAMGILEEGYRGMIDQYVALNLLELNNNGTYHSSGGNGYTGELPAPGYTAGRVRPCDMWASAEAQELAMVSPAMHAEFATAYEKRLLEPFGLTGYGCCESLSHKLDDVLTIPHIRRISISPWADVDVSAERLGGNYIFSWKPNPAWLVGGFNEAAIEHYIRHTVEAAQRHGGVLEIILKDTHTCEGRLERFDRWSAITRRIIDECPTD
ncbi:MAG: hypothetical protein M1457_06210 [bacterium]|nr:hypothetical protein [bacterium]